MREKFAENSIGFITKYYEYEGKKLDKLYYGLQSFYSLFTKTFVILIVSILLDQLKETLLLIVIYASIRSFAFGLHANKSIWCWLITIPIYSLIPYFSKFLILNEKVITAVIIVSMVSFLFFAPADTPKKPLINAKKRTKNKIITLIIGFFMILIILFVKNNVIKNLIIFSLLLESICINPITYKLLNIQFNNYKTYKK